MSTRIKKGADSGDSTMAVNSESIYLPDAREKVCQLCTSPGCKNSDCSTFRWTHLMKDLRNKMDQTFRPFMKAGYSAPPSDAKIWKQILYDLHLPMTGNVSRLITLIMLAFFVWAGLWSILTQDMLPKGNFFGLYILVVFALIAGYLVERIKLAPLLGMLIVGCVLRNAYPVDYAKYINHTWNASIKSVALAIILTRAGLDLDQVAIRKHIGACASLAFVPTICITGFITIVAHYMINFPWLFSGALGFLISAVSPAVIVPIMLSFQEQHLGGAKGMPSLVIASATFCDVIAICGNGIVLGIALSNGSLAWNIGAIPLTIVVGIGFGLVFGCLLWYFPSGDDGQATIFRFILLLCFGILCIFGAKVINLSGAGALGTLITPVVATRKWRQQGGSNSIATISLALKYCWVIFQPLLFGLIGAAVDLQTLIPERVGTVVGLILSAHIFQFLVTLLATCKFGFNWKETLFLAISFLPKATIQAAIGSTAWDIATKRHMSPEVIQFGRDTLNCAVLAIVFMAPIGGVSLLLFGPKLLEHPPPAVVSPIKDENNKESDSSADPPATEMKIMIYGHEHEQTAVRRRTRSLH